MRRLLIPGTRWLRLIALLLVVFAAVGIYLRSGQPASMQQPECHSPVADGKKDDPTVVAAQQTRFDTTAPQSPETVKVYTGTITGAAEVPPTGSPGTGTVTVTVNNVTNTMRVQASFSGLVGTTTAAHIHCCGAAGTNQGVATTTPSFVGFPLGVTSGSFDQTYDMTLSSSYNPTFVTANGNSVPQAEAALFAGLNSSQTYFNIHTSVFGGGEIRAQLLGPAPTVRSGAGATATDAALLAARDVFRTDLGGGTVAGANGSFGGLRREINWDGVPDASAAPNTLAPDFFNVTSPRGVVFSTAGTGFQASSTAASGTPVNFGNINANYTSTFAPFTPQRLFTALGSNVMDINFRVPGTTTPAMTRGFGAIFSDVDAGGTSITLFDIDNTTLGTFVVPAQAGTATFSFLGVSYTSPLISRVRIISGNSPLGAVITDGGGTDLVVMDDFLYGEPAGPLAAGVSISGRVVTAEGRGVRNATVTMTDQRGENRVVRTGPLGRFEFTDVPTGETYVVAVSSRRFRFEPQVISVNDSISGLVFTSLRGSMQQR